MILDIYDRWGLNAIAQVDLERRIHRNQDTKALGRMAFVIQKTFLTRLKKSNRIEMKTEMFDKMIQYNLNRNQYLPDIVEMVGHERPPMASVQAYRVKNSIKYDENDMETKDHTKNSLIDNYNRRLSYLRISITDHCNLNCIYCQPYIFAPKASHDEILRYEEILRIVNVVTRLGISKVRVTGGEPLVRKGVYEFLNSLNQVDGLSDISLTTNGVILKDNLEKIKSAGIKRMNISLDSLHRDRIKKITGHDVFQQIWDGILKAHDMGFSPSK